MSAGRWSRGGDPLVPAGLDRSGAVASGRGSSVQSVPERGVAAQSGRVRQAGGAGRGRTPPTGLAAILPSLVPPRGAGPPRTSTAVAIAQWQSSGLWHRRLRVRAPLATPTPSPSRWTRGVSSEASPTRPRADPFSPSDGPDGLRGGGLRDPRPGLARRPGDRRRGERGHPEVFAGKSIKDVADHFDDVIRELDQEAGDRRSLVRRPADPDPGRSRPVGGVGRHRSGAVPGRAAAADLGAAVSAPVLTNPLNYNRAVPLTYEQFRYAFANAVSEDEAHELYDTFAVPAPGEPLFQAAAPTSIHGPRRRSTRRTPTAGRCSSSMASSTTRCPGRSRMPRTTARSATPGSPRSPRSRARPRPHDRQRLA